MGIDVTRVRAICFDVDGTLNDTDDQLVERFSRWLAALGWLVGEEGKRKLARRLVMMIESPANGLYYLADSVGLDGLAARMFRDNRSKKAEKIVFQIIPGVLEMLEALKGRFKLAVVSARGEASTLAFLKHYGLEQTFHAVITAQSCRYTKPYPDPILEAARVMGVSPSECLMVGDTTVDIKAGRRAGTQTAAVLCGFGTERELRCAGANVVLESTSDLMELVKK